MLGKLFKHEFIYTAKRFLPLYIIGFAAAGVLRLFNVIWDVDIDESIDNLSVMFFYSGLYIALNVAVMVLTIYAMYSSIPRFHKNMFSDEGYLTNTLPVSPYSHVLCKYATGLVWYIVTLLAAALIQFIAYDEWRDWAFSVSSLYDISDSENGFAETAVSLYSSIASYSAFILMCYMCDSIRAMSGGRNLLAILIAAGLLILNSIVLTVIFSLITTALKSEDTALTDVLWLRNLISSVYYTIAAAAMFFITGRNLKERLNLQ